jgi:hypothetical protein
MMHQKEPSRIQTRLQLLPSPSIVFTIQQQQQCHRDLQLPILTHKSHQLIRCQYRKWQNTKQEHQQYEHMQHMQHQH